MIKLLCSDYDRTLRIDNVISDDVRKQIGRFRKAGNLFCINTGRHYHNMLAELTAQRFDCDYVIGGSGSQVFDSKGNMLAGTRMSVEAVRCVTQQIMASEAINITIGTSIDSVSYRKKDVVEWNEHIVLNKENLHDIYSISTRFETEKEAELFQRHVEEVCYVSAYQNRTAVDIAMKGVSKATGIDMLRRYLSMPRDHVYAIGDGLNDIAMLEAYDGFCVNHAADVVKAAASKSFVDVGACITYLLEK